MSIPSVRFKPPPRRISLQRSGPICGCINNHRPTNPALISFVFSSSDDSSDDLPMILTNSKNQMHDIPLESSSDNNPRLDNDQDDDYTTKNQVNWASKSPKPQNLILNKNRNLSNSPTNSESNQSQSSQQEQQVQSSSSTFSTDVHPNNPIDSGQHPQRRRKRVRKVKVPQQTDNIQQGSINEQTSNDNIPDYEKEVEVTRNRTNNMQNHNNTQNHSSNPENNSCNAQKIPQLIQTNPLVKTNVTTKVVDISNSPPNSFNRQRSSTFNSKDMENNVSENVHPAGVDTFIVVKEIKHSRKNNADFRMMKNEKAVYFARVSKDEIGIYYIISKTLPIVPNSPDNVGYLRKQNHGKRYTVYGVSEKSTDDREPEVLGIAFIKNPDYKSKQKTFRIAYRKDGKINYPISKRRELSRIAEDLQDKSKGIATYFNKPPTIGPDGNSISNFGSMFVVDSSKNYVISDDKNQTTFMIFKFSEASYTVKSKSPFNALMAFGLSIAIIEDCR